jgi:hypothetical protein
MERVPLTLMRSSLISGDCYGLDCMIVGNRLMLYSLSCSFPSTCTFLLNGSNYKVVLGRPGNVILLLGAINGDDLIVAMGGSGNDRIVAGTVKTTIIIMAVGFTSTYTITTHPYLRGEFD